MPDGDNCITTKDYVDALLQQHERNITQRFLDNDNRVAIALAAQDTARDKAMSTVLLVVSLVGGAVVIITAIVSVALAIKLK